MFFHMLLFFITISQMEGLHLEVYTCINLYINSSSNLHFTNWTNFWTSIM